MLEIKSYDDWITNQKDLAEPTTNLKKYADYVRSSYYNAGQLNKDTEQEIRNGVEDRLRSDGLITEDMPEEDQNNLFSSVVGSSRNTDTDARFVLDHFRTESEDGVDVNDVRASTLANYLTMREKSPSEADGFKPYVDEILADKSLVKRARMSAVDRGEYSIAALDEEDGKRTLYAGPNAQPDAIGGEISSLLATGAISSSDLYKVNDFVKSTNGGLSNGAKDSRFETFTRSVADLAKTDKDFNGLINSAAAALKEEKTAELRTTGEAILEGAKTVVTYPFIKGAELIADVFDGDEVQPKYAPDTKLSDVLASNPAFNKRFSAAEIEEYSDALTNKVAGAPYRADRPESGITTDSMGNLNIAPQLLYNTAQFEKAVALAPLNKDQQKQASVQRKLLAETGAPDMLKMVLEEDPEAVSKYAKAKADGLSASKFLEQYVADTKNYDAFDTRLEQFGKGAWKTLAEFPLGIAALAGNEWAAKEMGDMMKDQTRRQEFSRLHGDEYGFGFQLLNVLPQVAVDIGLTIGTGGAFAGAKALAKTGAMSARSMIRSGAKMALSEVDDVAATSFRQAAEAGGEQYLGTALKEIGRSVGEKFGELAPLAAVTLTRSAGSAFGSIYNQLPDDMSHEEKYKTALPTALAMGVSTAVITVGLSGLGFAGTEAVATRAIRRLRGGETDAAVASGALEAAERAVPVGKMNYRQSKQAFEDVYNEGQILNDEAFNTAARAAITGTYKNWLKTTLKGGLSEKFEEALDTAVGTALEDAALDRDTPLSEKVAQVFNAGLIGGSLGAGIAGATQFGPIRKSEQSLVFEGRASAFEEIANRLRSVDSNATADVLQRRIEDERAKAKMSVEGDVAIQSALDKFQERTEAANRTEKPIEKSVFEQAFFSKPLQAPVWDAENNKWITSTEEQKPNEPLLVDLVGQRVSYGNFDGVLEEGPNKSVHLRLDKPYGKKGGQMVELINLGPRFQKASNLVSQEPTFLTTGETIFDVPAGTPYVTQGKYKEKFAFPPKDKVTPESFKMEPDDEGNVRSIMIDGGQSLKNSSVRMPIIITGDSQIQAVAKWYGLDIEPKPKIEESPEGQLQFGFAEGEIQDDENLRVLTPEELSKQTEDSLQQMFPTAVTEGQMELQSTQQIRVKKVLQQFDSQIASKQESLKKVTAAIESFVEPFKDIADKDLTDDQRFIKKQNIEREKQSTDLKKKLTKELSALKKAKKNYSEDTIQLGGTPTPTPSMGDMDRDWVSSLDQIKTNYSTTVDGPLDVAQLEDAILATRLSNKMGVRLSFSDVTDSQLDAIEQMANDVISYANDPENTASETTRKTTQDKYADLLGRVQIIQQYRAEFAAPSESEYKQIYKELRDAGFEVTLPEEEVQPEVASDLDTLHYLLSTKPQKVSPTKVTKSVASIDEKTGQPTARRTEERNVGTVTIFPFANPTFIQQAKTQGVEINEERLTETQVVQIEGYDQDTREILYKGEGGITMRAPLSIVDLSPPTLRELIDAESKGVFDATQQAKRDAAAFKRRTSKPIQDRAIEFLTSVSNYVKKITELDARLEGATGRRPSSFVKKLKNQISEVKKQASTFINQKGGLLVDDIQFYQSLDDNGRQEIIDSVRTAIYGQGGYKSVAPRAKVYVLRPEAKIPTTKVELPKGEFRKGTQEEQLVQELIEGGFKVDLQGLGQRLALSRMFETESGMMKYPAFSGSIVENVQQAGQEVAETNSYIKNSNEFLEEEILKRYPQLGEFAYSSKAAKSKGKISSVGNGDAMLASIQVKIIGLDSSIAQAAITGRPVPDAILNQRELLQEQLKKHRELISEERNYKIGKKDYETRLSQQYTGVHYPIEEEIVQGETITFGVFTNNFEITRAQIAAGLRIRIPDSFDRDLFNPAQHKSKDGNMIDGYYLPYEQEPYMVGTTYRTSNPNIDENGEQVLDLRVTQNVLRKRLLVDRMVNPELMKVRVRDASGEERFRSSRFRDFYVAAMDAIVKRSRIFLESMAKNQNPRYPWTYIGMDNTISELSIGYTADLNEYRLAQHIVKKAMGSLNWKNLTNESMGRETLARFLEEEGGMKFEYEEVQDPNYVEGESRIKTGPRRRVVSNVTPSIEFGDLPDSIRRQIITEEGNITDKIKATNLSKFVVEMMDGDVDSIANDIKAAYKDIRGTDPHSVISEYARRLFVNATVVGGRFYSLPNYAGSDMYKKLRGVANKYAKAEQDAISRISLDALPDLDGFDVESVVGAAGNDLFQAVLDHITSTRQKLGAAGASELFESAGELTGALTSSELAFVDRGAFLADELYNTVQSDEAVGQAFRSIAEWVGLKKNELDNLSDTAVVSALAGKLNTDYVFHTNKGAARIALARLSQTEAGKRAAGLLIMRGWLPPVMVDGREVPLQAPSERGVATPAASFDTKPRRGELPADKAARELLEAEQAIEAGRKLRKEQVSTKEIIDYSRQYLDAVQSLLPSINEASRIKSLELRGIEEARADIYDSYRLIRALVGATTPEEGGMVHTKTQKEIAEGIELGAPFVTSGEVNKFLSKEVAAIQAELTTLQDKRNKVEQLFEQDAPRMLERLNLILNGSPDFTYDENGKPVPVKGGGKPPLLETVKDKKKRRELLAEVRQLQEKSTAILTFGRETMDSLDASISVKKGQLQKAEERKNIATPVLLDSLFDNIDRANRQIDMQRGFISRLSTTVRDRIKEEQASVERLRNLEPYKRYVELVTGLPVVAERSAERTEQMEAMIERANRSAKDRKTIQDYADKRREELAKALINSGVGFHNSGLLSTYVDPVDVAPTPAPAGAPVTLTFSEGNFSEAERAASTPEAFTSATQEIALTGEQRAARAIEISNERVGGVDVPTREVGGRLKPLSKPRAYDPDDQFQSLSTLDPALRDEARAENIAEVQRLGLESGNPNSVVEALKVIAKTGSPRQRLVAELLSTAPDFIRNIRFAIVELDLGFAGLFDRDSNTVVVNINEHNGRGLVDVLLHEYLHAPTVNVLLDPKTTAQRKAVARIEAIRNFAAANAARLGIDTEPAVRLGLQSNVEFLTYAFTAPDFQNILAGLTLPQQRSILRRIVDAVLSIFGLDPKKHMVAADAIQELFDFTKMSLAHSGTFSLDGKMRALSRSSRRDNERALTYSNLTSAELINNVISRYTGGDADSIYLAEGAAGPTGSDTSPINVLEEIKRVVPEGINLVVDEELEGAMGARRSVPNTIFVNPNNVDGIAYKLSRSDAKAAVRTAVDEELAHLASYRAYTEEDFVQLANEMGDAMVNRVAHRVFEHSIPDYTERQAFITSELESGNLRPSDIAAEWVRSQITIASVGRGREEHYKFLSTNPSLMNKFLEALRSFITELKQRLSDVFTTGTASKMSRASREFRRLRNGGVTPLVDTITGKFFGDSTDLLNALDGNLIEGQEDRVRYIYPFASTNPTKVDKIWDKIVRKMYDLPLELKALVNQRDGAVNEIQATMRDFGKRWPKLRDTALAAGVSIEDIGMLLGTTAPAVQGKARKELEREVSKFIEDNADSENLKALVAKFESERAKPIADNFFAQFRKDQKAMEDKLRAAGFSTLVNYLVDFRQQVNKYKGMINFDESNDVYLTRTYKFFTTEGWASAALKGGTIEIDGETVDFNKLRVVAAKHFVKEVEIDAKAEGITLTEDQKDQRTLEKLDAYLEDIQKRAQESKDLGVMNTVKRDINRLLQKKDFGEPLRALLGEVKDPFENAVRTAYSVGRLAANDRFLREFAAQAIELKLANREGGKDMELLFSPKVDAEMGDLAGLYVHKDIAAAIRQELGPKGRDHETASMKRINGIGRLLSKVSGFATTTQTLGSVGFYPRNILGGMALLAANGIVNPVNARTAIGLSVAANLRSADSKETLDTIRRLTELQVINDETRGRIAMDMFRGFTATTDEQLEELMTDMVEAQVTGKVDKLMKRLKVKEGFMKTVDVLAAINDTIDSAMKINAYLYELDVLTKAYGNTEDVSKLEAMAARKVKLYMPTHSDQVSLIKAFNRSPFAMIALPFARWKSEVLRTMLNIVPLAMEEINSGNAVMRGRGVKRLIGFSSTILGGGTAFGLVFGTLFSLLTGDDEEDELGRTLTDEELEAVKEGLPEYQRNHGLFARKVGKDGVQVIDLTNILPYSMTTDLVKLGASGNVKGMAEYMAKEVVGAQIAANTLIEVFNNRDGFGNAIALQSDNAPIAAGKLTLHLMKGTVIPSAFKKGADMLRYGQQNALELAAGELTGARPVIHKAADLEYRGLTKIKTSMDEAVTLLYPLSSGKAFDPTKVEGLIDKHQAASNVTQKRLYDFITSMKNLGSTDEDIFATSNKIGISKQRLGNAMQGLNSPWIPNDAWFKKMYANKTRAEEQDPEEIATELIRILPKKADEYSTSIY